MLLSEHCIEDATRPGIIALWNGFTLSSLIVRSMRILHILMDIMANINQSHAHSLLFPIRMVSESNYSCIVHRTTQLRDST